MKAPESIPECVQKSLERWAKFHNKPIPEIRWDCLNGNWSFESAGMYHGVELDGNIHT